MDIIEDDYWSDKRPYYIIYEDKAFLKNIYAQIYSDFPDVGQIAYIGTNTRRLSKDYSINGEQNNGEDLNKNIEDDENNYNKNVKQNMIKKANVAVHDSNEESEIREYANIREIKEMNNMLFYKQMLRRITHACKIKKSKKICHIKGKITLYDKFKETDDVFIKINNNCVWLKKENMDTSAINMSYILGEVHLVGYIIEEETSKNPRVIKAIAMYT